MKGNVRHKNGVELTNRVCLVTGGAQGIGWATSLMLADYGARVYICDISEENLARAAEELHKLKWSDHITLARCDVANRAQVEGWIREVYEQAGHIDVLVNNAAFVEWEDVLKMTIEATELTMRVGYDGMVYGVKTVLPLMLEAGQGHIVNISSIAGQVFVGGGPSAAYSAAKAAIEAYTQMLQVELKNSPVHVALVRLGTTAGTDFLRKHVPPGRMPRISDFLPLMTPPQVAAGIVRAIRERRAILNIPGYLNLFHLFYVLAPGVLRWILSVSGSSQRNFGEVEWHYRPRRGK